MGEHKLPRPDHPAAPARDEVFYFHDEATGKDYSVREATTEMLERHVKLVTQMHIAETRLAMLNISKVIGELVKLGSMKAVMDFELDRRKRKGGLVDVLGGTLQ